ncbi:MAG: YitT family protein [Deltaproteobacteria bacterium]|jgi:uncharacterized membrane-anchored protein YitT (DUF2179 family)|nr:YitT family protein [Deltaproteobacteria bacterium]
MRRITMSMPWNILLLTIGGTLYAFGMNAFAVPHGLISGGLFGSAMLIFYQSKLFTVAIWYTALCIPVALIAWLGLSRRFVLYSLYGTLVTIVAAQFITYTAPVTEPLLGAIAGGTICGIGSGIMLRTLGSDGGLTMLSMVLYRKYNIKLGVFSMVFNTILFCAALVYMDINLLLYSIILIFLYSSIMDYSMEFTNQRKLAFIISDNAETISAEILERLHRGVTYLYTKGGYTNQERYVIMTVVHNYQLKRLEELVYRMDPKAFLIIENTHNVIGRGFSELRVY